MKPIAIVLSLILIAGCAATGHLNTPSGRPEVTVHATLNDAQKESLHWLLGNGYTVGNPGDTKELISLSGHQLIDNGNTNIWVTFNYFSKDTVTTTIYASKIIWYRHGGNRPQTTQADYEELQGDLTTIAQDLAPSK